MQKVKGFLIIIICLIFSSGMAQITITWPATPVYKTIPMKVDSTIDVSSLNLAVTGGPQAWNFQEVIDEFDVNFETVEAANTTWGANFPDAEWAQRIWQYIPALVVPPFINIEPAIEELHVYRKVDGNEIKELGMGSSSTLLQGSPFTYPTPSTVYPTTLTINSPDWDEERFFEAQLLGVLSGSVNDSTHVTVDGWGTIQIPSGTYPCIRIRRHEFRTIDVPNIFSDVLESMTYVWLTNGFDMVLSVTFSQSNIAGLTNAMYVVMADGDVGIGCDPDCRTDGLPTTYSLRQNYPNPFNPTTRISYNLPQSAEVELKIFSMLGQTLAILDGGVKSAGEHFTTWNGKDRFGNPLSAGIYFYQLTARPMDQSESIVQTKKMILTK